MQILNTQINSNDAGHPEVAFTMLEAFNAYSIQ